MVPNPAIRKQGPASSITNRVRDIHIYIDIYIYKENTKGASLMTLREEDLLLQFTSSIPMYLCDWLLLIRCPNVFREEPVLDSQP